MRIIHISTQNGIEALLKSLPTILPGMQAVIATTPYANSIQEEVNLILGGYHKLWLAFDDSGAYQGFCTTCVEKGYANIVMAYAKVGNAMIKNYLSFFEDEAKKAGLRGVMFYTARDKGFERATRDLGYKAVITQFVKEVV